MPQHPKTAPGDSHRTPIGQPIYIVTDVEVDGPVPGENSMLSFASVAVSHDGSECGTFNAVLAPLPDAAPDADTLTWIKAQPGLHTALTQNARDPADVMDAYVTWVRSLGAEPVFAAHPLAMDGLWIDHYLKAFAGLRLLKGPWHGERLFYDGGLCIRSFAAGRLGRPLRLCAPEHYDPSWMGGHAHTHRALDDARGYATLLRHLLSAVPC